MLTVDLVRTRRKNSELLLLKLTPEQQTEALLLTDEFLGIARASVGDARDKVETRWRDVAAGARDRKLALGLLKLVEDRCDFSSDNAEQSASLRAQAFRLATERRRRGDFERTPILVQIGEGAGLSADQVDGALFADLRGAERLSRAPQVEAALILAGYGLAQQQAVLLRAVRVVARIKCKDPALYRHVFQKLKFRRLLFEVEPCEAGYQVSIDGPYSLFESVTKYGLALAVSLPVFLACDGLELLADVRWGAKREPLTFSIRKDKPEVFADAAEENSELNAFVAAFLKLGGGWKVDRVPQVLQLKGVGVCVPDLAFTHVASKECVYFEVMGYWSREAVFRRLELVERGLGVKLLFAVNEKLRVSAEVARLQEGAALYVFKRTLNARAVLEKLETLRQTTKITE